MSSIIDYLFYVKMIYNNRETILYVTKTTYNVLNSIYLMHCSNENELIELAEVKTFKRRDS